MRHIHFMVLPLFLRRINLQPYPRPCLVAPVVSSPERDPSQAAPACCGIANEDQKKKILPTLHKMYERMQAQKQVAESSPDDALSWSSFVLPFLESAWSAGDKVLASSTVEVICDRIYSSMDRRSLTQHPRLGWPGVSCEIWGAHGAFGGEVYGWGAVMPAHIIRNLLGFRETEVVGQFLLSPAFGPLLVGAGKQYGITDLLYAKKKLGIHFTFQDERNLLAELDLPESSQVLSATDANGRSLQLNRSGNRWQFKTENYAGCVVKLS